MLFYFLLLSYPQKCLSDRVSEHASIFRECYTKEEGNLSFYSTYTYSSCSFECKIKVRCVQENQSSLYLCKNLDFTGCSEELWVHSLVSPSKQGCSHVWSLEHQDFSKRNGGEHKKWKIITFDLQYRLSRMSVLASVAVCLTVISLITPCLWPLHHSGKT